MQEMEREMMKLREVVKRASEMKKQQQQQCGSSSLHHTRPAPTPPPTMRTEAARLPKAGEKKRVARQPVTSQKSIGTSVGDRAGGQRPVDRGVADDIIRQRQEDEKNDVMTEKYSRLRIKSVCTQFL